MRDSELAASIVAGEPEALAEVYRKYGDLLWSYCRSLLREEDNAAEAVADTFVIAASKLAVLPALGRLRAWLYAVARIECRRRMRFSRPVADSGDGERLRRTVKQLSTGELRQLHALLYAAFAGLDDAERDVMQLAWHGLDLAEVAAVLGVTRRNAHVMFSRARDQLEVSVGVILMGWSWRGGCDTFEDMHDGRQITPDVRARLGRHVAKCAVCTERYREQLRPTLMPFLSASGLLSEAADARSEIGPAPVGLWEQVYQMTSQQNAGDRWNKILGRSISFGPDGFPRQLADRGGLARTSFKVAAVGTVAVAATATAWATHGHSTAQATGDLASAPQATVAGAPVTASNGAHAGAPSDKMYSTHKPAHAKPSGSTPSTTKPPAPPTSSSPSASSSRTGSASSSPTESAKTPGSAKGASPSASATVTTPQASASASTPASTSASSSAPTSSASSTPAAGSTPGTGTGSGGSGSGGSSSAGPDTSPSASAEGTLSVSTHNVTLALGSSSSLTLTADGGPVNWSITVPSRLLGSIDVSQRSGSLEAGESVTVTLTATGVVSVGSQLTINPGDQTVTVDISLL